MPGQLQAWMPLIGGTLPIVFAVLIAAWLHNKRVDSVELGLNGRIDDVNRRFDDMHRDVNRRFDEVNRRIDEVNHKLDRRFDEMSLVLRDIQATLKEMDRRLTVQEERGSPIIRQ